MGKRKKQGLVLVNTNPYARTPYYGVNGNGNGITSQDEAKKIEFKKWDEAMSVSLIKLYREKNKRLPDITDTKIVNCFYKRGIMPTTFDISGKNEVVLTIGIPGSGCELFEILNRPQEFLFLATVRALKASGLLGLKRIIQTFQAINNGTVAECPQLIGIPRDARSTWPADFARIVQQATAVLKNERIYQTKTLDSVALELESKTIAMQNIKIGDKIGTFLSIETDMDPELIGAYLSQVYGLYICRQTFSDGGIFFSSNFEEGVSYLRDSFSDLVTIETGKEGVWDMRTGENQTCFFARRIFDISAPETELLDREITDIIEGGLTFTLEKEKVVA